MGWNRIWAAALAWVRGGQRRFEDGRGAREGRVAVLLGAGPGEAPVLEDAAGGDRAQAPGIGPGAAVIADALPVAAHPGLGEGVPVADVEVWAALALEAALAQADGALAADGLPRAAVALVLMAHEQAVAVLAECRGGLDLPAAHQVAHNAAGRAERAEKGHVSLGVTQVPFLEGQWLMGPVHAVEVQLDHAPVRAAWHGVPGRAGLAGPERRGVLRPDPDVAEGVARGDPRRRGRLRQLPRRPVRGDAGGDVDAGAFHNLVHAVDRARNAVHHPRSARLRHPQEREGVEVGDLEGLAD
mmetsp:Transcript_91444/g.258952  ORF Transcript_91444/g.258952 Transcript_91444/m.258952 type:complete len:299 (+) Transcript_91444:193-1089(+)